jgi:hypothetical protein
MIFAADPIRATLAHGRVTDSLQGQHKVFAQTGNVAAAVGLLEVLALHAVQCASGLVCARSLCGSPRHGAASSAGTRAYLSTSS